MTVFTASWPWPWLWSMGFYPQGIRDQCSHSPADIGPATPVVPLRAIAGHSNPFNGKPSQWGVTGAGVAAGAIGVGRENFVRPVAR